MQAATTAGVFYLDAGLTEISLGFRIFYEAIGWSQFNSSMGWTMTLVCSRILNRWRFVSEVLQALLTGSTNLDIANQLFVSESTIKPICTEYSVRSVCRAVVEVDRAGANLFARCGGLSLY